MNNKTFKGSLFAKLMVALLPFGAAAQSIHIGSGAQLIETGSIYMTLNKMSFINDGRFTAGNGSVVSFVGGFPSTITTIGGTNTTPFSNLLILKSTGGDVMLNQDITVNAGLGITFGNLLLNGHTITIGNSGSITREGEQAGITGANGGKVVVTRAIPTNIATNPGNIGAEILINGTPGSQTILTIERTFLPEFLSDLNQTITSINRGFTISSVTNSSLNYRLRFFYFNKELNGNTTDQLSMWSYNAGSNSYTDIGKDSINLINKSVIKNNLAQLGHFTLGNQNIGGGIIQPDVSIAARSAVGTETTAGSIKVYPNPVQNKFRMELFMVTAKQVQIGLYDQSGRLLQRKEIHCNAGINSLYWDVRTYAAGVYFIKIENSKMKDIKIVKE